MCISDVDTAEELYFNAYSWGSNMQSQLGLGTVVESQCAPRVVGRLAGLSPQQVACGFGYTLFTVKQCDERLKVLISKKNEEMRGALRNGKHELVAYNAAAAERFVLETKVKHMDHLKEGMGRKVKVKMTRKTEESGADVKSRLEEEERRKHMIHPMKPFPDAESLVEFEKEKLKKERNLRQQAKKRMVDPIEMVTTERAQQILANLMARETTSRSTIRAFRLMAGRDIEVIPRRPTGKKPSKRRDYLQKYPSIPSPPSIYPDTQPSSNSYSPRAAGRALENIKYSPRTTPRNLSEDGAMHSAMLDLEVGALPILVVLRQM